MCRGACDAALLRGEWKALLRVLAPQMCLERGLVLSAPAFLIALTGKPSGAGRGVIS